MSAYPPSGRLWANNNKGNDRHPDYRGDIEFPNEVVQDLYAQMQKGEVPKASVAGWRRESQAGNRYLSLFAKVWVPKEGGQQRAPQHRAPQQRQPDSTPHGRQQERRAPAQQTFDDEIPF